MYPVSDRFLDAITGTHESICRCRALVRDNFSSPALFGVDPAGIEIPVEGGDVKMTRTGDIKTTLEIDVPGTFWQTMQPYSVELFVERGIDYGDGTQEYVPLGYFRNETVDQDEAPDGPLKIDGNDRAASMMQNRVLSPLPVPAGKTHRKIFQRIVNGADFTTGIGQSVDGYGAFIYTPIPITWESYNPDTVTVVGDQMIEDSSYDFLEGLAQGQGCTLRFDEAGGLFVEPIDGPPGNGVVARIMGGPGGNLIKASRSVTRAGVYNIVSAYGSDPAFPVGYAFGYNEDEDSPLFWSGRFGAAPRYFASPLLQTGPAVTAAAATLVATYKGLPESLSLDIVPHPALRPTDLIDVDIADGFGFITHEIDEITIPLTGDAPVHIATRTFVAP